MFRPLAVLPLHLACQFLVPQNCSEVNVNIAVDDPLPKIATDLPDGYAVFKEVGVAYKNYKNKMQWDQARKVCTTDGGHLAVLDSFEKIQYVMGIKEAAGNPHVGIHRLFDVTEWTNVRTGLPAVSLPWRTDTWEADMARKCTALWQDGSGLYAMNCNEAHPFVCEIPIFKD